MSKGTEKAASQNPTQPQPITTVYQIMIGAAGTKGRGQKKMAGIVHSKNVGQKFIDGLPVGVKEHCSVVPLKICHSVQELKEFVHEQALAKMRVKDRLLLGYSTGENVEEMEGAEEE